MADNTNGLASTKT